MKKYYIQYKTFSSTFLFAPTDGFIRTAGCGVLDSYKWCLCMLSAKYIYILCVIKFQPKRRPENDANSKMDKILLIRNKKSHAHPPNRLRALRRDKKASLYTKERLTT